MLDIDTILVDHEGDTACGDNYEYDALLLEIRQAIEGKPEQQIGKDYIIEGEEPDWKLVKKNCLELCSKTHNLEVIISLTQALMHLQGYLGLAEGSALLSAAIERYWECIYPQPDPDDNDPTERLNLFAVFKDYSFLLSVQKLTLVSSKGIGSVNLYDIRKSKQTGDDEEDSANAARLTDAVFAGSEQDELENVYKVLEQCISNFENITSLLRQIENVGDIGAPGFTELLKIINESKKTVGSHIKSDDQPVNLEGEDTGGNGQNISSNTQTPSSVLTKGIHSRADVITALDEIEAYFIKNEPGSPIPLLLRRAKGLVDKDFISLMEDLAPDSVHQVGLVLGTTET